VSSRSAAEGPGQVAVSGASGLIGRALVARLRAGGARVRRLVRPPRPLGEGDLRWDPSSGALAGPGAEALDALVHLAGESVAGGRWTSRRKRELRDSRVGPTRALCETLARAPRPPALLIAASAVGYYGDRGEEIVDERSGPGRGFLAELCVDWEQSTRPAREAGIRVVHLRTGIVLAAEGGALPRLRMPFQLGLGGPVGSGRQYVSWVALEDAVGAIEHVLRHPTLEGPVNLVSPDPVRNAEFARALGRVLGRSAERRLPEVAVRLLLGEMGVELLLFGARVRPARLTGSGYAFAQPELEGALRAALGRS
jgi:uncharacterized protein (TIGR01777 family)